MNTTILFYEKLRNWSFFEPHSNIVYIEEVGVSKVESDRSLFITNQVVADVQGSRNWQRLRTMCTMRPIWLISGLFLNHIVT
jgi:hypothetical protein